MNGIKEIIKRNTSCNKYTKTTRLELYDDDLKSLNKLVNNHDRLVEENNILTNARLKSDAKNLALRLENEHFLGVLKLLKADLLERSEKDSQGMKVVNISSSVWEIAKETIYQAEKKGRQQ